MYFDWGIDVTSTVRRRRLLLLVAASSPLLVSGCAGLWGATGSSAAPVSGTRRSALPPARLEATEKGFAEPALHAFSLVGIPYRWGGNTPAGGFDCSGLVVYVMRRATGKTLPRTVEKMWSAGREVPAEDRLPGDLVFFNTTGKEYSHVGIYIGQNRFVHAPNEGGTVRLESLVSSYWGPRITGFRRIHG
ncbi:MAG: hypothetical protein RIR28_167 [Pseudomonadota bacterium]